MNLVNLCGEVEVNTDNISGGSNGTPDRLSTQKKNELSMKFVCWTSPDFMDGLTITSTSLDSTPSDLQGTLKCLELCDLVENQLGS